MSLAENLEDSGTGSPAATAVAIHWIRTCVTRHRQCNPGLCSRFFPTRIIDLGSPGEAHEPVIVEHAETFEPYVALSHRWGDAGLPQTTLANIAQRKRSVSVTELSKTMQEAIAVVRSLGFRYLWIDALCIIQDSKEDWLRESLRMSEVFKSAILTIAVTDSDHHSKGVFTAREASCVRPVRFEDFRMPRTSRSWFDGEGVLYVLPSAGKASKGVRPNGALDSRGWVLQEQLLSPRILYYSRGELFWDCVTVSASESSPISSSLLADDRSSETWALKLIRRVVTSATDVAAARKHMGAAWLELATNYSARKLSNPKDKLMAMEGILIRGSVLTFGDALVSGMWKSDLWKQLTWWTPGPNLDSHIEEPKFLAPSWSWMSTDGPISYLNSLHRSKGVTEFKELAPSMEILDVRVETISREAEMRGILAVLGYTFPYRLTADDLREPIWKSFNRKKLNRGRWWFETRAKIPVDIECLVLAEDNDLKMLVCLCIVPSGEADGSFRRIGLCHWEGLIHDIGRFTVQPETRRRLTIA